MIGAATAWPNPSARCLAATLPGMPVQSSTLAGRPVLTARAPSGHSATGQVAPSGTADR